MRYIPSMGRALVFALISAFFHFIVLRWAARSFPRLGPWRMRIWLAACSVVALAFLTRLVTLSGIARVPSVVTAAFAGEMAFVAVVALPILLVQIVVGLLAALGLAVRAVVGFFAKEKVRPAEADRKEPELSRRLMIERAAGLAFASAAGGTFVWGATRGRVDFETIEVVVRLPGLPRVLDGYTIAQVSDLHVGTFCDDDHLRLGFDHIVKMRPDLVVATGDLIDHDVAYAKKMADALASLGSVARDGVSAILGNHDYYAGRAGIVRALRDSGVNILINEGRIVRPNDGGGFALLGVDDLYSARLRGGGPLLAKAEASVAGDRATVLLSHQPSSVDAWPGRVGLQLSGHTHGGQINPVGFSVAARMMKYVHGRYETAGGTTLYVNRGFGSAGVPVLFGALPEITKIVIVSG
jgi:predicted MPP superfamily phosphohydrolase